MKKLRNPFRKVEESSSYGNDNDVGKSYIFVVFLHFCRGMKYILEDFARGLHVAFYGYMMSYEDLLKLRRELSSLRNSHKV